MSQDKNKLSDLRASLFSALDNAKNGKGDSEALFNVCRVADRLIEIAKVEVKSGRKLRNSIFDEEA